MSKSRAARRSNEDKDRGRQSVRTAFDWYDCGIIAAVPSSVRDVYGLMQRYIWRDPSPNAPSILRDGYRRGLLVCRINQSKMARILDLSRRQVSRCVKTLKDMGWIEVEKIQDHKGVTIYVLGLVVHRSDCLDEDDRSVCKEWLLSDGCVESTVSIVTDYAKDRLKNPNATFKDLDEKERLRLVKHLILRNGQAFTGPDSLWARMCSYSTPPRTSVSQPR